MLLVLALLLPAVAADYTASGLAFGQEGKCPLLLCCRPPTFWFLLGMAGWHDLSRTFRWFFLRSQPGKKRILIVSGYDDRTYESPSNLCLNI